MSAASSPVSLCNRAFQDGGCRTLVSDMNEATPAGINARLFYNPCRQQLLRAAQWGFARKTFPLQQTGDIWHATSIYPWPFKYAYPPDCLKMRYVLPQALPVPSASSVPQVGAPVVFPYFGPSRTNRFLVSTDDSSGVDQKVLLTNLCNAQGVYTKDVTNVAIFDALFEEALVQMLEYHFVVPLSGNIKLKSVLKESVETAVRNARAADGNEAIPTTDIKVDWIEARGAPSPAAWNLGLLGDYGSRGMWYSGPDSISWGA